MKKAVFIIFLLGFALQLWAQSTTGITHVPDTSYNVINEYNKHRKNYPQLGIATERQYKYVQVENDVVYFTLGNRVLKADVYSPAEKATQKRTAIVFIHGGGWRSGNKNMHRALLVELSAMGYVCIAPEYRLSTEALYPAAIHDIKTAIRWTRKNAAQYNIDIKKIVVAGHSSGGELAAFMGATNGKKEFEGNGDYNAFSSRADAVIDLDGTLAFIHPESGEGDDSKKTSAATYWLGWPKTENPELWKQAAPLTHVGKHSVPFLFINSSMARMHAGRNDFIAVLNKHKIYSEIKTLEGAPHSFLLFHPWFDTTVVYMQQFIEQVFSKPVRTNRVITVAADGSGQFTTVQAAINAVPANNKKPVTILIKKGVYQEKILVDSTKKNITLTGEDKLNTILTWNDHTGKIAPNGDTMNTRTSWSIKILANNFTAQTITFRNDAGFSAGQAVAVESDGDKATFINCRFIGNQDVLFTNSEKSRQYYERCYIEGTTDFIFGSATVWFEKCRIYSKKNSHITAASTPRENKFGYVFNHCQLEGDTALHHVSLGRPWRPYASVTYLHCYLGPHIKPEGWSVWNNNDNHKTARYAEYENFGPSAVPSKRLSWTKQLTAGEAKNYNRQHVLGNWLPATGN